VRHRRQGRDTDGRSLAQTDINRDTQGQGHCRLRQGYSRTGSEKQTDRERNTYRQGQGYRHTGTGTHTDRDSDTDGHVLGKGYRLIRTAKVTGKQTGRNRDTDGTQTYMDRSGHGHGQGYRYGHGQLKQTT
jgi:hypothetical protein